MAECLRTAAANAQCGSHADPSSDAARLNGFFAKLESFCQTDTQAMMQANGGAGDGTCTAESIKTAIDCPGTAEM